MPTTLAIPSRHERRMAIDYKQWITAVRDEIDEISVAELSLLQPADRMVVDVREPEEFETGIIPGAVLLPRGRLEDSIGEHIEDPTARIILYCSVGERSALAAQSLGRLGYRNVQSLSEGIDGWKAAGRDLEIPEVLPTSQRSRYSRHLLLSEVGSAGQHRLLASRVLLIGAGGLGSPAALYLAAAGIGTIGIVDSDVVDTTNLQRQIVHTTDRLGQEKAASARQTLNRLNPDVEVIAINTRLTAENVLQTVDGYDLVVDGADNFPTRYLINDASLHVGVPVIHGSVFRFEGQASVFRPYQGPCYRCLFPAPPPTELAPSCAEAGVLGALPGIIGSIQAVEAIKILLGVGEPLVGRLLLYDALDQEFRTLQIRRDPECPACGDPARPPRIVQYNDSCRPAGRVTRTDRRPQENPL